ncbi:unnamed protein product [Trypanosoma congolense IL3000]|uniref:LMBR1-like membrane protein n=1 Tax=Trypanosoma congolense (strain IL3000) TaxID=1068625 RepID=F9W5R3_TRYCI|nr:conserved hypothetical protein [Trypanosoma congolense IL3000]CCD12516.1 unnamed protein product [Trypanosoma congolense IL3000]
MASGYVVCAVIFCILSFLVTLILFRYYARLSARSMPILCSVFIIIAVYASLVPFPLLVVDLEAALEASRKGVAPGEVWLIPVWYTIMAVTNIMGWVVLPVSHAYTEVGQFTVKGKLLHSIKENAKLYAISIVIFLVLLAYVAFLKGAHDSFSIINLVTAMANAWGLLLLVLFMSTGLVLVPKMLWQKSDSIGMLRAVYYRAVDIQEDRDIAFSDLMDVMAELVALSTTVPERYKVYCNMMMQLIDDCEPEGNKRFSQPSTAPSGRQRAVSDLSLEHLQKLHERVKKSIKMARRADYSWDATVSSATFYENLICGSEGTNNVFTKVWFAIRGPVYKLASAFTFIVTVLILWSELTLPFRSLTEKKLSVVALVVDSPVGLFGSMVFLFYMAYCAYWAIFQLKVFDVYVILPEISDNASLCFVATFLSRLIMPLCFNFLLMTGNTDDSVDVMYGHVYHRNMDASYLLGSWLNECIPIFIVVVAALVLVNIVQCLLRLASVEVRNPNDIALPEVRRQIEDGHRLISRAVGRPLGDMNPKVLGSFRPETGLNISSTTGNHGNSTAARGERYREYIAKRMEEAK